MINSLTGTITECGQDYFCLLTGDSIEWFVLASQNTLQSLEIGKRQKFFIYTQHKEDDIILFGFVNKDEKTLFINLIKVNGIGPKVAIKAISHWNVIDFLTALEQEDVQKISTIPGIGKKTAEKIVLTLKDKIKPPRENTSYEDIIETLTVMGYKQDSVRQAVLKSIKELEEEVSEDSIKKSPTEKKIIERTLKELK